MNDKDKRYLREDAIRDAKLGIIYASIQKYIKNGRTVNEFIESFIKDTSVDNLSYFENIYCLYRIVEKIYPESKEKMDGLMLLI